MMRTHWANKSLNMSKYVQNDSLSNWTNYSISFLNFTVLALGKYFLTNSLTKKSEEVTELAVKLYIQCFVESFKVKGINFIWTISTAILCESWNILLQIPHKQICIIQTSKFRKHLSVVRPQVESHIRSKVRQIKT